MGAEHGQSFALHAVEVEVVHGANPHELALGVDDHIVDLLAEEVVASGHVLLLYAAVGVVLDDAFAPGANPVEAVARVFRHVARCHAQGPGHGAQLFLSRGNGVYASSEHCHPQCASAVDGQLLDFALGVIAYVVGGLSLASQVEADEGASCSYPYMVAVGCHAVDLASAYGFVVDATYGAALLVEDIDAEACAKPYLTLFVFGKACHLVALHDPHADSLAAVGRHGVAVVAA